MSLDTMTKLAKTFADSNSTCFWFNMMGGETTLHPKYEDMVGVLAGRHVRFVTNGWWIDNPKAKDRMTEFVKTTKAILHVGVSRDRFHPEGVGVRAFDYLMSIGADDDFGLSAPDPDDEEGAIASVGRAFDNYLGAMRSTFGAYCQSSNTRNTSFTVLEDGTVTHCPFGIYPIGNIEDGLETLDEIKAIITDKWDRLMLTCRSCWQNWIFGAKYRYSKEYPIYNRGKE